MSTTYEIPAEPADVRVLWTVATPAPWDASSGGAVTRWTRTQAGGPGESWTSPDGARKTWRELLDLGRVHDQHPALLGAPPLPWVWDDADGVRDARGLFVDFGDDEVTAFITTAVNAHAERLAAEPAAPTALPEDMSIGLSGAVRSLAEFWRDVASAPVRQNVADECGGLVERLDMLLDRYRNQVRQGAIERRNGGA